MEAWEAGRMCNRGKGWLLQLPLTWSDSLPIQHRCPLSVLCRVTFLVLGMAWSLWDSGFLVCASPRQIVSVHLPLFYY